MARAIVALTLDVALRRRLASEPRATALELDWERELERLDDSYREILDRAPEHRAGCSIGVAHRPARALHDVSPAYNSRIMKLTTVTTTCPFCSGGVPLMNAPSDLTNAELSRKLAGTKVECPHAGCGRTFAVRRAELRIHREDA